MTPRTLLSPIQMPRCLLRLVRPRFARLPLHEVCRNKARHLQCLA